MPRKKYEPGEHHTGLLEKLLVVQLHALGATQDQIVRVVGRRKLWVNSIVRGLPKRLDSKGGGS